MVNITDYIIELDDGRIICTYVDDGLSRCVLITEKGSFYKRDYDEPLSIDGIVKKLEEMEKKST